MGWVVQCAPLLFSKGHMIWALAHTDKHRYTQNWRGIGKHKSKEIKGHIFIWNEGTTKPLPSPKKHQVTLDVSSKRQNISDASQSVTLCLLLIELCSWGKDCNQKEADQPVLLLLIDKLSLFCYSSHSCHCKGIFFAAFMMWQKIRINQFWRLTLI